MFDHRVYEGLILSSFLLACSNSGPPKTSDFACDDPCGGATRCTAICACEDPELDCDDVCDEDWTQSKQRGTEAINLLAKELLDAMNELRAQPLCCDQQSCDTIRPPLTLDDLLQRAATGYAEVSAERGFIAHTGPEGEEAFDRVRETGFRGCALGENLASGQASADEVIEDWLASPAHCDNLLSPDYHLVGVGQVASADVGSVWVVEFGAH